ncbi:hypothetical protein HGM15179_022085, partial [Zosterops borbonicus]
MALSSRAHAFSVEALVGRSAKRKVPEGRDEEPGCRPARRAPEPGGCRGEPGAVRSGGRPLPRQPPEPPLPLVFPAEKRPKAGAESRAGGVQVELQGSELWRRFHDIGTEMIITKAG